MPRDGSQARTRLRAAALELYRERGYDETTTAQIATRAGVTERTYFRHFADKREVLFDGEAELRAILVNAVATAPDRLAPLPVMVRAFTAVVPLLIANRSVAQQRAEVIAVTPALQERAYAKTAALIDALTDALTARGITRPTARLTAQVGMAAFERANRAWADTPAHDLTTLIAQAADEVLTLGGT
ncbi:TetR family transcriptional regulator [Solihabitans fulvus]|uniref:TetR family transcriptional regulator n=2 Tax=Solihabitans fulvus TaxID=1892852 RepID=A0A5B2WPM8_9PSEU|nr:TetR family transcriptional regulator [Solihabitans fulvus]